MRILSLILAFAFLMAVPVMSGTADAGRLPGIGTFSYNGSSVNTVSSRGQIADIR